MHTEWNDTRAKRAFSQSLISIGVIHFELSRDIN